MLTISGSTRFSAGPQYHLWQWEHLANRETTVRARWTWDLATTA